MTSENLIKLNKMNHLKSAFLFLPAYIILFFSCSNPQAQNDDLFVVDLMQDLTIESTLKLSDIAKDIDYVKLENGVGFFIQRADKYSITDDYILIYDRTQDLILLFSREGKFLRKISSKGNGPGEYNRPNDVRIARSGEFIIIHNSKLVMRYDFEGQYLGSITLPSWATIVDSYQDGLIGVFPSYYSTLMDSYSLVTFDMEGNITGQYGKMDWEWLKPGNPMKFTRFYKFDNVLNFHEDYYDTVYCLTPENEFKPRIYFECENKPLRDADEIMVPFYKREDVKGFYRHGWVETENHFFIQGTLVRSFHLVIYSKENHEARCISWKEGLGLNNQGIPNDLDGGSPFWPRRYMGNKMYSLQDASNLKQTLDSELVENSEYKNQKLRDKLLDFKASLSDEDGHVLTIVTLN